MPEKMPFSGDQAGESGGGPGFTLADLEPVQDDEKASLLGRIVRGNRERLGWTTGQLAAKSGVDEAVILQLESGEARSATSEEVDALAKTFEINPVKLRMIARRHSPVVATD